jgi:hypothetical protein
MRRPLTKKKVGLLTLATVAISSSLAYAYWTGGGSGTGSADTASNVQALTVVQTAPPTGMAPGDVAQVLSGKFNNPNTGPVFVGTVTASIAGVTKKAGAAAGTCDATAYTLGGAAMAINAEVPAGTNVGAWSGATIKFNNKVDQNQDACKGATVKLAKTNS